MPHILPIRSVRPRVHEPAACPDCRHRCPALPASTDTSNPHPRSSPRYRPRHQNPAALPPAQLSGRHGLIARRLRRCRRPVAAATQVHQLAGILQEGATFFRRSAIGAVTGQPVTSRVSRIGAACGTPPPMNSRTPPRIICTLTAPARSALNRIAIPKYFGMIRSHLPRDRVSSSR